MTFILLIEDIEEFFRESPSYLEKYPTERKLQNAIKKRYAEYQEILNQPLIDDMVIKIEWKKSRTWGYNPHAEVWATPLDRKLGTIYKKGYTASGCGYSKRGAVIEQILNDLGKHNILDYVDNDTKQEWGDGICMPQYKGLLPYYGLSKEWGDFTNFTIEHYAWGETFDEFHVKFKQRQ